MWRIVVLMGMALLGACSQTAKAPAKPAGSDQETEQQWIDDKMRDARAGHVDPDFVSLLSGQTQRKLLAGDFQGALITAEPLAQVTEIVNGPNSPKTASALEMLADLYCNLDRCAESIALLERAGAIYQQQGQPGRVPYVRTLNSIGASWNLLGQPARAEPVLKQSLALSQQYFGTDSREVGVVYWLLMSSYSAQGRNTDADAAKAKAQKLLRR